MRALLAAFLIAAACTSHAQAPQLDRPLLLVAAPDLQGPYGRTALLVVPAAGGQHFGFILNRVTDVKLATLFPEHGPSAKVADPVYFGGPVMSDSIFAVRKRDLSVTGNAAEVDRIIEQSPDEARYFAGFVGWEAGELAKELEAGFWYTTDPDANLLFRKDTRGLWDELVNRLSRRFIST